LPKIFKKNLAKDTAGEKECEFIYEDPEDNDWDDVEGEDSEEDDDEESTPY
jgi:hypothetical protein